MTTCINLKLMAGMRMNVNIFFLYRATTSRPRCFRNPLIFDGKEDLMFKDHIDRMSKEKFHEMKK